MMDIPRGITSRRSVLAAVVTSGGLILVPQAAARATQAAPEPADELFPHHDVTQVTPEELVPPDGLDPGGCGSTVWPHNEILGFPTPYEGDGRLRSFSYDDTFYSRVETWFQFFRVNTPIAWGPPFEIWCWGVFVDKGSCGTSFHKVGRAFDISRIYATDPATGTRSQVFNSRHDIWGDWTGSDLTTTRKRYWGTAASLHYHFRSTLTYFYDSDHDNHIHFDNGISGSSNTSFSSGSDSQVQHLQAALTYVWGETVGIDGIYGPQSTAAANRVITRIGRSGTLSTQANWLEFNRATLRFASGTQTY
jgi:hypothetical protein